MVRRVGFGGDEEGSEKPARAIKSKPAELRPLPGDPVKKEPMGLGARIFSVGFLSIWLIGWSGGIVFAAVQLITGSDFSRFFLVIWLAAATVAWYFAAKTLVNLVKNRPVTLGRTAATTQTEAPEQPKTRPVKLTQKEVLIKAAQIALTVGVAIRMDNDFIFMILFFWAGNEFRLALKRGVDWDGTGR